MKNVIQATNVGSTYRHEPGYKGRAVFSTLERGQYAIRAKEIVMENAKTNEVVSLGSSSPVTAKELFQYGMVMPKSRLDSTFAGKVGSFFSSRGSWKDKNEWIVKYVEA